jgi:hypothetical protein
MVPLLNVHSRMRPAGNCVDDEAVEDDVDEEVELEVVDEEVELEDELDEEVGLEDEVVAGVEDCERLPCVDDVLEVEAVEVVLVGP